MSGWLTNTLSIKLLPCVAVVTNWLKPNLVLKNSVFKWLKSPAMVSWRTMFGVNQIYFIIMHLTLIFVATGLCGGTVECSLVIQEVVGLKSLLVIFQVTVLGKLLTCMSLCHHAVLFSTGQWAWCSSAGKITAGLAESNDSLPPGGWLKVTCGLTACTPGSVLGPVLDNEYGRILLYLFTQ